MTTTTQTWNEQTIEVDGLAVQVVKGGSGDPLLILHEELGHPGWMNYHEALSQSFELTVPSHPGFGGSAFVDWIMNMRDLAGWYLTALDDMGIQKTNLLGFSLGGWLAAELATMDPSRFNKLVLVNPMGIKPPSGEIFDMFLVVAKEFLEESILDPENTAEFESICPAEPTPEQVENWEVAREQACRLTWRPYMHYRALPHLLRRLQDPSDSDHLGSAKTRSSRSAQLRSTMNRFLGPSLRSSITAVTAPKSNGQTNSSTWSRGFWRGSRGAENSSPALRSLNVASCCNSRVSSTHPLARFACHRGRSAPSTISA